MEEVSSPVPQFLCLVVERLSLVINILVPDIEDSSNLVGEMYCGG